MTAGARAGTQRLRIIVLGYVVRGPLAGPTWHHLQYVLGLAALGHDVYFVEDSDDYESCYRPDTHEVTTDPSYGLEYAASVFERAGIPDRWAYHDAHTARWSGPLGGRARQICTGADVVVNVSGVNPIREWCLPAPVRILVDTDPVFTQVRHLSDPAARTAAARHTAFASYGESIAAGRSDVPDDGLPWYATRQPVVLDAWSPAPPPADGAYTTVMSWESYAAVRHAGRRYGMKSDSFREYLDVPRRTGCRFEVALGGEGAPAELLRDHGWAVRDPIPLTVDPWVYQEYLRASKAEFGVAKQGYVVGRTGWFSDRSAAYLATGRPVITQDTGFSQWIAVGSGLLAFGSDTEAVAAVEDVEAHHAAHCRAAREVAEEFFDARRVLATLLDQAWQRAQAPRPIQA